MATLTLRPTSGTGAEWTNIANVYDGNQSTLGSVSTSRMNYTNKTLVLNFDTSAIPSGATINSATLTIRSKAGKTTVSAYVDINQDSANRVISQKQTTSVTNYTVDVTSYMSTLTSVKVTPYNTNWSNNTFELYELWIDVDYTAITTYTVTFKDWDGSIIDTQTVSSGGNATPPTPTRTGYDFTGWSGGSYTNVTSDTVLTAQYSIKTFTVRFLDWNNNVLSTQTIDYGSSSTPPPNPTRDGYTFSGWQGNYTNVTADVDIIAQYTQNSSGGGSEDTSVKNIKLGASTIDKLYLGTSQILKAYLGNILLYSYSAGGTGGVGEEGLLCELQATNHGTDNSVWKDISGNENDATIYNYGENSSDVWSSNFLTVGTGTGSRLQLNDNLCSVMEWTIEFKIHVYEELCTYIPTIFAKRTSWTDNMLFCLYLTGSSRFWIETPQGYDITYPTLNNTFNIWKIYCNQSTGKLIIKINDTEYLNQIVSFDTSNSIGKICLAGVPDVGSERAPMDIEYIKFYKGNFAIGGGAVSSNLWDGVSYLPGRVNDNPTWGEYEGQYTDNWSLIDPYGIQYDITASSMRGFTLQFENLTSGKYLNFTAISNQEVYKYPEINFYFFDSSKTYLSKVRTGISSDGVTLTNGEMYASVLIPDNATCCEMTFKLTIDTPTPYHIEITNINVTEDDFSIDSYVEH